MNAVHLWEGEYLHGMKFVYGDIHSRKAQEDDTVSPKQARESCFYTTLLHRKERPITNEPNLPHQVNI